MDGSLDYVVKYAVESGASRLKTQAASFNVKTSFGTVVKPTVSTFAPDQVLL